MVSDDVLKEAGYVLICHGVAEFLDNAATMSANAPESGGILIGRYRGPHIEITGHTTPAAEDISSYWAFIKQDPVHQEHALQAWKSSNGTDTDVGEWHTHPAGEPSPSGTDSKTWKRLVRKNRRRMVFVVAVSSAWALYAVDPTPFGVRRHMLQFIENGGTGRVFA